MCGSQAASQEGTMGQGRGQLHWSGAASAADLDSSLDTGMAEPGLHVQGVTRAQEVSFRSQVDRLRAQTSAGFVDGSKSKFPFIST